MLQKAFNNTHIFRKRNFLNIARCFTLILLAWISSLGGAAVNKYKCGQFNQIHVNACCAIVMSLFYSILDTPNSQGTVDIDMNTNL